MGIAMKSTSTRYGTAAISIHWLCAGLILVQLGSGFRAAASLDDAAKQALLTLHAPLGMVILVLMVARAVWWWLVDTKPAPVSGDPLWQTVTAKAVHVLFYVVLIGMGLSGLGLMVVSGAGAILSGQSAGPLPDFSQLPPRMPHGLGARLMLGLLALHVGAALYHHFVKRDGLIWRMWYGKG